MSKRLWYKRYPSDFIAGTILLTAEQKGIYTVLLDLMYDRGTPIVDDAVELGRICGCSTRRFKTAKVELAEAGKIILRDGLISNPRFENQILNEEKEHEKLGLNGRKGAEKTNKKIDVERENNGLAEKGPTSQKAALLEAKRLERKKEREVRAASAAPPPELDLGPVDSPEDQFWNHLIPALEKAKVARGMVVLLSNLCDGDFERTNEIIRSALKANGGKNAAVKYLGKVIANLREEAGLSRGTTKQRRKSVPSFVEEAIDDGLFVERHGNKAWRIGANIYDESGELIGW